MMDSLALRQRLNSLRSLVADRAESSQILKEVDSLIGISKQDQKVKDEQIVFLKAQCKSLRQKVKRLTDQMEDLAHTKENIEADFEILTIKYENLQAKLKAINQKCVKETRNKEKKHKTETKSCEIQVEIISEKMVHNLSICYQREFQENQALRRLVRQYEMQAENQKVSETLEETDDSETNISEEVEDIFELPTRVGKETLDVIKGAEGQTQFDSNKTTSKHVITYLQGK